MTRTTDRIGVGVALMAVLLLTAACDDSSSPTAPSGGESSQHIGLSFAGLENLGDGFVYEGWILVNGSPVSTGTFTVSDGGSLSQSSFLRTSDSVGGGHEVHTDDRTVAG